MTPRSYLIPSGAVGLSLLSACTPTIAGDWELSDWTIDGYQLDLQYNFAGYYYYYTASHDIAMSIDKDLTGDFSWDINIDGYGTYASYSGDVTAEKINGVTFNVLIDVNSDELDLECVVDGLSLACDGESDDGTDHEMDWDYAG